MAQARIITDSTAYLTPDQIAQHEITVLPVDIHLGDQKIRVGSDHNLKQLFQRMVADRAQIAKAVIPPSAFEEAYGQLGRQTDQILVIVGSSKLSSGFRGSQVGG